MRRAKHSIGMLPEENFQRTLVFHRAAGHRIAPSRNHALGYRLDQFYGFQRFYGGQHSFLLKIFSAHKTLLSGRLLTPTRWNLEDGSKNPPGEVGLRCLI